MPAHFTPETLRFLRALDKHNDRVWFEERRPIYERALRDPLHAVIAEINRNLVETAPEHIRPAHKVAMRIYRDTRFSPDKRPYKRHLSAWWARTGLEKTAAAGFYLQVGPAGVIVAGGIYAPERQELLSIRQWLASEHPRLRAVLAPLLKPRGRQAVMQLLEPNALTRNPKGFPPDHPAGDLLRQRNWGAMLSLEPEAALAPDFASAVAAQFHRLAPLVTLLNEPFLQGKAASARAGAALDAPFF